MVMGGDSWPRGREFESPTAGYHILDCFLMGHSRPLFLYFCLFNTVERKEMFNINFADDWL